MKSRRAYFLPALAAALLLPREARAGSFGFLLDAGLRTMSNSADTERAIFDSEGFGFGLGVTWDKNPRWRVGLDARSISRDGERAFAADRTSPAFRLGHPLNLKMYQGVVTLTRRFGKLWGMTPYVGAGGGFASWKEKSDTAGLVETADGTAALIEGRLGFERAHRSLRYGIEGGLTFIPNAIGKGGISQVYEENDLGGVFVVARIGFSR